MKIPIHSGYISGIPHRGQDISSIAVGDPVILVLDPTNQFDPMAIQVHIANVFVGFVAREQTPPIHVAVQSKAEISAIVTAVGGPKWKEITFQTFADYPSL
jgi:predicted glycosyltransferase